MAVPHTGSEAWTAAMHKLKDVPECADVNSSNDVELLKMCDGVVSPWQAWHNSEAPPQVSAVQHHNNRHHKRSTDFFAPAPAARCALCSHNLCGAGGRLLGWVQHGPHIRNNQRGR